MLGERLAEIRKNYHDTQKSLADKLGLTVWAVSAWEQGRNSPPSETVRSLGGLFRLLTNT
jgi:transcriptional regulator with XRE-family HTH domain